MVHPLLILGAGGHAKMVIEAARSQGLYEPTVCLGSDANDPLSVLGVRVAPETDDTLRALLSEMRFAFVAIGSNRLRRKLSCKLEDLGYTLATIVANGAWLSPSARVGAGSVLLPRSAVGADASLGKGCIINTCSSVDHDCWLGDWVHIAPGSHLGGKVQVGEESFLGVGCSVIPEKRIGSRTTLGSGAVVVRDIPDDQTWVGCPARFLK